jgi:hypothetical protein
MQEQPVQIPAHVTVKGLAPRPGIDALVEHDAGEHRALPTIPATGS